MLRTVSILVILGLVAILGFLTYNAFLGPDRLNLAGLSVAELLKNGELWRFVIFSAGLIMFGFFEVASLRDQPPAEIRNGVTAEARVVRMWDTGTTVNDDPQVGLLLQISPPGGAPAFQGEARLIIPIRDVPYVKPGTRAEIMYDPKNPQRLKILALHIPDAAARNTARRLQELEALLEKRLISDEEFQQKRSEIIEEQ
jgi:hypothetical protein